MEKSNENKNFVVLFVVERRRKEGRFIRKSKVFAQHKG
jgi:hypothetical protein